MVPFSYPAVTNPIFNPDAGVPRTFHHSGTTGDLLASLPVIRHMGGGRLLLRLHNTTLAGRMGQTDIDFLTPLLLKSGIVTEFRAWQPGDVIHHDLDGFRMHLERTHWSSIIGLHFIAMGFDFSDRKLQRQAHLRPFLKVDTVRKTEGRYIGVARTPRHRDNSPDDHYFWKRMVDDGIEDVGLFFGLPMEHAWFEQTFKCRIPYQPVANGLEMAEHVAGLECFTCSPTMAYWVATGLQKTTMLETRHTFWGRPAHWSRHECNNHRPHGFFMPYQNYIS